MKSFVVFLTLGLVFLGGCSSIGRMSGPNGTIFNEAIGVIIFQGSNDTGMKLGVVRTGGILQANVPAGFEMFTGEFSNGRGGEGTNSINLIAGQTYYLEIGQKGGFSTPDIVFIQSTGPQVGHIPAGMSAVLFSYPNPGPAVARAYERAKNIELLKILGCRASRNSISDAMGIQESTCQ